MDAGGVLHLMVQCATVVASKHSSSADTTLTCIYDTHFFEVIRQGRILVSHSYDLLLAVTDFSLIALLPGERDCSI